MTLPGLVIATVANPKGATGVHTTCVRSTMVSPGLDTRVR